MSSGTPAIETGVVSSLTSALLRRRLASVLSILYRVWSGEERRRAASLGRRLREAHPDPRQLLPDAQAGGPFEAPPAPVHRRAQPLEREVGEAHRDAELLPERRR